MDINCHVFIDHLYFFLITVCSSNLLIYVNKNFNIFVVYLFRAIVYELCPNPRYIYLSSYKKCPLSSKMCLLILCRIHYAVPSVVLNDLGRTAMTRHCAHASTHLSSLAHGFLDLTDILIPHRFLTHSSLLDDEKFHGG